MVRLHFPPDSLCVHNNLFSGMRSHVSFFQSTSGITAYFERQAEMRAEAAAAKAAAEEAARIARLQFCAAQRIQALFRRRKSSLVTNLIIIYRLLLLSNS